MDFKMWICIWFASHYQGPTLCKSSIATMTAVVVIILAFILQSNSTEYTGRR